MVVVVRFAVVGTEKLVVVRLVEVRGVVGFFDAFVEVRLDVVREVVLRVVSVVVGRLVVLIVGAFETNTQLTGSSSVKYSNCYKTL